MNTDQHNLQPELAQSSLAQLRMGVLGAASAMVLCFTLAFAMSGQAVNASETAPADAQEARAK